MRIEIACFTAKGLALGGRIRDFFRQRGDTAGLCRCGGGGESLTEWTAKRFSEADALIFVGAAGIAVRAIAPYIASKVTDPAVAAADENGGFVIPLLSGHIGGANRLASDLARGLGAVAVVTTATDIQGVFAVDVWAAENGFALRQTERIRDVSSRLLDGGTADVRSAFPVDGPLPKGLQLTEARECAVLIDVMEQSGQALQIIPPAAVLGVGCRRGTAAEALDAAFAALCAQTGLCPEAVGKLCSIDLKQDEAGLLEFAAGRGMKTEMFSAGELAAAEGQFASSDFVKQTTGTDNVCERSAVMGSGGGRLLAGKTVFPGITMALALRDCRISFDRT